MSKQLLQAIAVTSELTGTQLSEAAARVMAQDLANCADEQGYSIQDVFDALKCCQVSGIPEGVNIEPAILTHLHAGRPSPEQAWQACMAHRCIEKASARR